MKCLSCPHYESRGMTTGDAWNRCNITGAEYFFTQDNCDLVDENVRDNGKFDELMREYEESHRRSDEEKSDIPFANMG